MCVNLGLTTIASVDYESINTVTAACSQPVTCCVNPLVTYNSMRNEITVCLDDHEFLLPVDKQPKQLLLPAVMRCVTADDEVKSTLVMGNGAVQGRTVDVQTANGAVVFTLTVRVDANVVMRTGTVTVRGDNNIMLHADSDVNAVVDAAVAVCPAAKTTLREVMDMVTRVTANTELVPDANVVAAFGVSPYAPVTVDGTPLVVDDLAVYRKVKLNCDSTKSVSTVSDALDAYMYMDTHGKAVDMLATADRWRTLQRVMGAIKHKNMLVVDEQQVIYDNKMYIPTHVGGDEILAVNNDSEKIVLTKVDDDWVLMPKRAPGYSKRLQELCTYASALCTLTDNHALATMVANDWVSSSSGIRPVSDWVAMNDVYSRATMSVCPHCGGALR